MTRTLTHFIIRPIYFTIFHTIKFCFDPRTEIIRTLLVFILIILGISLLGFSKGV